MPIRNNKFCDDVFPPGRSSLVNEPQYQVADVDYRSAVSNVYSWKRPSEYCQGKPTLFYEDVLPGDIEQGELGDCWLLSALSTVGLHPGLIKSLFVSVDEDIGQYTLRFYQQRRWVEVTIDDRIPCNRKGKPIFGHCVDDREIWVVILEKGIAKLLGSYECLDGGFMEEGIHLLTGGRCEKIRITDYTKRNRVKGIPKEKLWGKLLKYDDERILMGCSIDPASTREARNEKVGLVAGHAYGILDVYRTKDGRHRLLKIRNPWGQYEWTGKWSDSSRQWTTSYRKELNQLKKDDGTFWMDYVSFKKYFDEVTCVRMFNDGALKLSPQAISLQTSERISFPNVNWIRKKVVGHWMDENAGGMKKKSGFKMNPRLSLTLTERTRCFLSLERPSLNQLTSSRQYGYEICFSIHKQSEDYLILPSKQNSSTLLVGPDYGRYVGIELILDSGEYIITPSTDYNNKKGPYHFSVYVEQGEIELKPLKEEDQTIHVFQSSEKERQERDIIRRLTKTEMVEQQIHSPSKKETYLDKSHIWQKETNINSFLTKNDVSSSSSSSSSNRDYYYNNKKNSMLSSSSFSSMNRSQQKKKSLPKFQSTYSLMFGTNNY